MPWEKSLASFRRFSIRVDVEFSYWLLALAVALIKFISMTFLLSTRFWTEEMASFLVLGGRVLFFALIITQSLMLAAYPATYKDETNTAIPHMVALEYRNTASKFSQIPKPQLQMGKS